MPPSQNISVWRTALNPSQDKLNHILSEVEVVYFQCRVYWPSEDAVAAVLAFASWKVLYVTTDKWNILKNTEYLTKFTCNGSVKNSFATDWEQNSETWIEKGLIWWTLNEKCIRPHLLYGRWCQTESRGSACWEPSESWTSWSDPHPAVAPEYYTVRP